MRCRRSEYRRMIPRFLSYPFQIKSTPPPPHHKKPKPNQRVGPAAREAGHRALRRALRARRGPRGLPPRRHGAAPGPRPPGLRSVGPARGEPAEAAAAAVGGAQAGGGQVPGGGAAPPGDAAGEGHQGQEGVAVWVGGLCWLVRAFVVGVVVRLDGCVRVCKIST